jgi:hypothetical protein
MLVEHLTRDETARIFTAGVLLLLAILQIVRPGCFWGTSMYFKGTRAGFSPRQRERLERVLAARRSAEGDTDVYSRYVGGFTILMAAVVLAPAVPYVLPYALSCLAMAGATLLSYLRFRRATERRVAPLVRRNPWASLPPLAVGATAICIAGAALFAAYPQFRVGAVIVVVAAVALLAIAWRVAVAPALLFGDDSQLEYLVDEHIRLSRATGLIALACAPATVLVELASATLPPAAHFFAAATLVVAAAFIAVMIVSFNPMRKRIKLA